MSLHFDYRHDGANAREREQPDGRAPQVILYGQYDVPFPIFVRPPETFHSRNDLRRGGAGLRPISILILRGMEEKRPQTRED